MGMPHGELSTCRDHYVAPGPVMFWALKELGWMKDITSMLESMDYTLLYVECGNVYPTGVGIGEGMCTR
jgi:hypothetical protein